MVRRVVLAAALIVGVVGCGSAHASAPRAVADPARSLNPSPNYTQSCAPSGLDNSPGCLQVALDAIDHARAKEGVGRLRLPATYATLPFDQQVLLVIDAERVDRHLPAVVGITTALDHLAAEGAVVDDLPPAPGPGYTDVRADADAGFANALDLDYQWMYDDGPGSGTDGCTDPGDSGCWADRNVVLADPGSDGLELGAAVDPTGDSQSEDKGGTSMALVIAAPAGGSGPQSATWTQLDSLIGHDPLAPLAAPPLGVSATGIKDPAHTEPPDPDYTATCATSGIDDSPACLSAVLHAVNHARAAEGVKPMVLPPGFATMTVPEQLLVAIDLERVDRGLRPFVGLTGELNANAMVGAEHADDPPDPGTALADDGEWSGGAVNGLDADYGWMYDDGRGSGNVDCPRTGGPGCWGHREGILDNFGTIGTLVMGAASTTTGDLPSEGFSGGTSTAVTLAVQLDAPSSYVATWAVLDPAG